MNQVKFGTEAFGAGTFVPYLELMPCNNVTWPVFKFWERVELTPTCRVHAAV